jgi:indole-3-glycerol phosphate synthase
VIRRLNFSNLESLAYDAFSRVESGYYDFCLHDFGEEQQEEDKEGEERERRNSLCSVIRRSRPAFVSEIKFASPSSGEIVDSRIVDVAKIALYMQLGGADAISVLTENKNFNGSISNLIVARRTTSLPIIMKDIVVSPKQIRAAKRLGADAILLIYELFEKNLTLELSLNYALELAHDNGLEVIVETCSKHGFERLLSFDNLDVIGINNRDLETFKVDLKKTVDILSTFSDNRLRKGGEFLVMSESGYKNPSDILRTLNLLESANLCIPDAFLIGTSIMRSCNDNSIEEKVRSFAKALQAFRT